MMGGSFLASYQLQPQGSHAPLQLKGRTLPHGWLPNSQAQVFLYGCELPGQDRKGTGTEAAS